MKNCVSPKLGFRPDRLQKQTLLLRSNASFSYAKRNDMWSRFASFQPPKSERQVAIQAIYVKQERKILYPLSGESHASPSKVHGDDRATEFSSIFQSLSSPLISMHQISETNELKKLSNPSFHSRGGIDVPCAYLINVSTACSGGLFLDRLNPKD